MRTDTRSKIISYIEKNRQARADDLKHHISISGTAMHRQLKRLVEDGVLKKIGKPPLVLYVLPKKTEIKIKGSNNFLPEDIQRAVDENIIYITPEGKSYKFCELIGGQCACKEKK